MEEKKEGYRNKQHPMEQLRSVLSHVVPGIILAVLFYLAWQQRFTIAQVLKELGIPRLIVISLSIQFSLFLTAWAFTLVIRSFGYSFHWNDSYYFLNISFIAAMLPGSIWGYGALAGQLWTRKISKRDSVLIVFLHTFLMLSAAISVGIAGLVSTVGWQYALMGLAPLVILLTGRPWLDRLRGRFFKGSSPLPAVSRLLATFLIAGTVWIITSSTFAFVVYSTSGWLPVSFPFVASVYPAGYVAGYLAPFAPSGLGVSEGVITLALRSMIGAERALAVAIVFRFVNTIVVWLNVAASLAILSYKGRFENVES